MVLSNGKVLIAPVKVTGTNDTLLYDPKSDHPGGSVLSAETEPE